MERVVTFAVLGDSAASGVGDAGPHGVNRGWAYYLTQSFMHPVVYSNLSRPGLCPGNSLDLIYRYRRNLPISF